MALPSIQIANKSVQGTLRAPDARRWVSQLDRQHSKDCQQNAYRNRKRYANRFQLLNNFSFHFVPFRLGWAETQPVHSRYGVPPPVMLLLGLIRMHDLTAVVDYFDALISFRPLQPARKHVTKSALRAAAIIDVAREAHQILHRKRFFRLSDYLHLILSVLAGKTQPEHGAYAR
jgi:hypothetical protein